MAEFPALQLWTDAYLGDTTHLNCMEHGAYLLLLMTAWRTKETRLPDDDKLLARLARCSGQQWTRLRPILQPFFKVENGFWYQSRLTDEAAAVRTRKEKAAIGGRAKALKTQGRHLANAQPKQETSTAHTLPGECLTTATATAILVDKSTSRDAARGSRMPDGFIVPEHWIDWAVTEKRWTRAVANEDAAAFVDFWRAKAGKDAVKLDWQATWRNWVRNSRRPSSRPDDDGHPNIPYGMPC